MNRVLALLKIDVKSLISAAIITAIINPLRPEQCDQQLTSQDNINMLSNTQLMGIMKVIILSKLRLQNKILLLRNFLKLAHSC